MVVRYCGGRESGERVSQLSGSELASDSPVEGSSSQVDELFLYNPSNIAEKFGSLLEQVTDLSNLGDVLHQRVVDLIEALEGSDLHRIENLAARLVFTSKNKVMKVVNGCSEVGEPFSENREIFAEIHELALRAMSLFPPKDDPMFESWKRSITDAEGCRIALDIMGESLPETRFKPRELTDEVKSRSGISLLPATLARTMNRVAGFTGGKEFELISEDVGVGGNTEFAVYIRNTKYYEVLDEEAIRLREFVCGLARPNSLGQTKKILDILSGYSLKTEFTVEDLCRDLGYEDPSHKIISNKITVPMGDIVSKIERDKLEFSIRRIRLGKSYNAGVVYKLVDRGESVNEWIELMASKSKNRELVLRKMHESPLGKVFSAAELSKALADDDVVLTSRQVAAAMVSTDEKSFKTDYEVLIKKRALPGGGTENCYRIRP